MIPFLLIHKVKFNKIDFTWVMSTHCTRVLPFMWDLYLFNIPPPFVVCVLYDIIHYGYSYIFIVAIHVQYIDKLLSSHSLRNQIVRVQVGTISNAGVEVKDV